MRAIELLKAVFGNADVREVRAGAASARTADGRGAPKAKLAVLLLAVLGLAMVLGVALADATAPVVTVENATNVQYTTAEVEGTVNPEGQGTSWRFEYATEADFSNAQEGPSGFTETSETVSGQLTGLQPGTTYHLRLLAENGDGQSEAVAGSTFATEPVTKPTPSEPQISAVTAHAAKFEATVNPNAPEDNSLLSQAAKDAYATHWWFTCEPGCSFSGPSEGDVEADNTAVSVEAEASSLEANREYTVILHARNAGGEETAQAIFSTDLAKPSIEPSMVTAIEPGDTAMTVVSDVNPNNSVTDCRVLYGIGSASGNEAPCSPSHPSINEMQLLELPLPPEPGQFKLRFESAETDDIEYNATAAEIEAALESLPTIGAGNVSVREAEHPFPGQMVTFVGNLAGVDVPLIEGRPGTIPFAGEVRIFNPVQGSLAQMARVTAPLSGLKPETEYRFKFVATNAAGTSEGSEMSFTTLSSPLAETCSNAAVRAEQHSTSAECRAYEMVSPPDKNGSNVTAEGTNILAATDGNAVVFQSRGGFGETSGSGRTGFTQYLSRRSSAAWTTKSLTPTPPPSAFQTFGGGTELFYFSDDLSKAVLWGYDLPSQSDDIADDDNLYRLDTGSGALETVTRATEMSGPIGFSDFVGEGWSWGASSDTGVISFASNTQLLPEATPQVKNTYEWDHGTLRLAGILPDGSLPSGGSTPPPYERAVASGALSSGYRQTISADGSRILFLTPFGEPRELNQQLYMRRDHRETVWIDEPEYGSPGEPEHLKLEWVSPDARKILFMTTTPLVEEDTNATGDLYLYTDSPNPEAEPNLELISRPAGKLEAEGGIKTSGVSGETVLGATADAGRIYFMSESASIMVWDHGEVRPIVTLSWDSDNNMSGSIGTPGFTRISPNGRYLAFRATKAGSDLPDEHGLTGRDDSGTPQLYLYDADENTLSCVSCRKDGRTRTAVPFQPAVNQGGIRKDVRGLRPRFLADDGKVFFSSPEPLVPTDTNGVMDAYVYNPDTGRQELISSGKGEEGQWFVNASSSGHDVFFATNQSLVGADPDDLTDVYDARIGGGFPEPPPPPTSCVGDNCRNSLSRQPGDVTPATAAFSGPGNRHRKPKHRRRHHHHRKHQAKRHHSRARHTPRSGGGR